MSLIEVMLAFLLILLISLYLMSLFASGQQHWKRAQQYSIASFLAHQRMQEALQTPLAEISPGRDRFGAPFSEYSYKTDLNAFESGLYSLDVEVVSNAGAVARIRTLVGDSHAFQGITVDPYTNTVGFIAGSQLGLYTDVSGSLTSIPLAGSRRGGGLSGSPGANLLWQAGQVEGLVKYFESAPAAAWGAAIAASAGMSAAGLASPRFGAVASDRNGNVSLVGDSSNRCLWLYQDFGAGAWFPQRLRPTLQPLGSPAGVATDPYASLVWVADQERQCLRKLLLRTSPPPAGFEADASGKGWWDNTLYKPAKEVGMGSPQGVAMDSQGWAVYVVDRARLYRFIDDSGQWSVLGNLPALVDDGISGLALDSLDSLLYINTRRGKFYKLKIPAPPAAGAVPDLKPKQLP